MKARKALGRNVAAGRTLRGMKQRDLAEAMSRLDHDWSLRTVSRVETGIRGADVDELLSLAGVLGYSIPDLLVPPVGEVLDLPGGPAGRLTARSWLEGAFAWLLKWDAKGKTWTRQTVETQREPGFNIQEEDLQ
jgi:transcriptional regulator with XRE-family HTH domain